MASTSSSWRERAFLGPLPDDFLRLTPTRTAGETSQPNSQQVVQMPPQMVGGYPGIQPFGVYTPSAGRLEITVNQARLTKNYGLTRMDPFCRVRVGHSALETPTAVNGAKNPRWNKLLVCNVPVGVSSAFVEIFDERAFQVDERIAWCHIEFPERLTQGQAAVEDWYPLNGKQGDGKEGVINIIMSFQPAPPQQAPGYQPVMYMPGTMPAAQVMYQGGIAPQQDTGVVGDVARVRAVQETDVQSLADMFPEVQRDVIRSVLENSGGNMERAVSNLLAMNE